MGRIQIKYIENGRIKYRKEYEKSTEKQYNELVESYESARHLENELLKIRSEK